MKVYLLHCNDRLSATVTEDTEDKFSFYFGWEEHGVTWRVSEIEVLES